MADERDFRVKEYVEESVRTLEGAETGGDKVFDESVVKRPLNVLEPRVPVVVEPQASALEAVELMQRERIGCVLVARSDRLKGIFTERDVLTQLFGQGVDLAKTPVRKIMTADPEYLRSTDSIAYALNAMSIGGYRHVPIVDDAHAPVGVISVKDIIHYIVKFFPRSVMNLPTLPRQNYATQREGA